MYHIVKRFFCLVSSLTALIILSPIFIIAIVGILVSDWGPVFYIANRIGKNNRPFKMYKFRSMKIERDANEKKFKADKNRIFKWGAFMRATKIDELPQLLNCLLGDMAIVGPRPAAQDQIEIMREGKYAIASSVKPGLTGPAALYDYLYGDSIDDEYEYRKKVLPNRLVLEMYYVQHMDMLFDVKMIIWTLKCIIYRVLRLDSEKMLNKLISFAEICKTENQFL